jgi:hypothetical protein
VEVTQLAVFARTWQVWWNWQAYAGFLICRAPLFVLTYALSCWDVSVTATTFYEDVTFWGIFH